MSTTAPSKPALDILFLGSGSSGNASLVRSQVGGVLVDCGFSARETLRRLALHNIPAEDICAILVTHEHTDHVGGVRVLAKRLRVPVYATPGTHRAGRIEELAEDVREIQAGDEIHLAGMRVRAFRTSHDAADPVGYRFDAPDGESFGLLTDTGEMTPEAFEALEGCTTLGIECNHDVEMLEKGPYPWFLKQRIASPRGHLSNESAMSAVRTLAHDGMRAVVGLHLSSTNNTTAIALGELQDTFCALCLDVPVACVAQDRPHRLAEEVSCTSAT